MVLEQNLFLESQISERWGGQLVESKSSRPLVLLAGWLGCKPKNLNPYVQLYESLGFDVIQKIPSTLMVFLSAVSCKEETTEKYANIPIEMTMHHLASTTIDEIQSLNNSHILIHVFSNGGAFFWEALREMLSDERVVSNLRTKLMGIVFDSGPCDFSDGLVAFSDALSFTSIDDRLLVDNQSKKIKEALGIEGDLKLRKQRACMYWKGMLTCQVEIPHLYICSKVDKLTPFAPLNELIGKRLKDKGPNYTMCLILEDSPHVLHYKKYPDEYTSSIKAFLHHCLHEFPRYRRHVTIKMLSGSKRLSRL
jgi:hypothetical protein